MRTNIVLDDELIAEAMKASGSRTKREAVERGLRALIRLSRQGEVRKWRGRLHWEGDLEVMRRDR
jgi:Arc/MetJ family transcription regulator